MGFRWLGTFRQGQWQAYRQFILAERQDVAKRLRMIEAELTRIGEVTVIYGSSVDAEGNVSVSEERQGFAVTPNSSLCKLVQAYVAQGGNPFDVSLFLTPDNTVVMDPSVDPAEDQGDSTQPYNGVVYPRSGAYIPGQTYEGGFLVIKKYLPARIGGRKYVEDSQVATRVDAGRRWIRQEIKTKREEIEHRIIKLCDLREQLLNEINDMTMAVAGVVPEVPSLDEDRFDKDLSVAHVVAAIDSIFYTLSEDGTPNFGTENTTELGKYPFLLSDISPDEDDTAL